MKFSFYRCLFLMVAVIIYITSSVASQNSRQVWGIFNLDYFHRKDLAPDWRYRLQLQPRSDDLINNEDRSGSFERLEIQNSILLFKKTGAQLFSYGAGFTLVMPLSQGVDGERRPYLEGGYRSGDLISKYGLFKLDLRTRVETRFQEGEDMVMRGRFFPRVKWSVHEDSDWSLDSGIEVFAPLRETPAERAQGLRAFQVEQLRFLILQAAYDLNPATSFTLGSMLRRNFNESRPPLNTWVFLFSVNIHLDTYFKRLVHDEGAVP